MSTFLGILEYGCLFCVIALPPYLIWGKGRFWAAFVVAWVMMVAGQWFAVESTLAAIPPEAFEILPDGGKIYKGDQFPEHGDTTSVGLIMFSGWLLALPYCIVLKLAHVLSRRLRKPSSTAIDGAGEH